MLLVSWVQKMPPSHRAIVLIEPQVDFGGLGLLSEIPQLMSMQSAAQSAAPRHIRYKIWLVDEVVVHNGHKTWTTLCRPATGSLQQDKSDLNGARLEGHHLRPDATVTGHARDAQCPYGELAQDRGKQRAGTRQVPAGGMPNEMRGICIVRVRNHIARHHMRP